MLGILPVFAFSLIVGSCSWLMQPAAACLILRGRAATPASPPTRRSRIDSVSINDESCLDLPMVVVGSVCGRIDVTATTESRHGYLFFPSAA